MARKSIIGLCMLCALAISAIAAQAASAEVLGTTAFTCAEVTPKVGTEGFSDSECKSKVTTNAKYEHVPFEGSTSITGEGGETRLHSVISGINVELLSTELSGTGEMENMVSGKEHTANGTGTITYKSVSVVKPEGKGCVVKTGDVTTEKLKATTAGQGMGLKFEPAGATPFAKFEVEGCGPSEALKALNGVYEVTGSVIGIPEEPGTGTVFTAAATTAQGTLKLRGQKAGIAGTLKLKGANGNRLAATTVTTP